MKYFPLLSLYCMLQYTYIIEYSACSIFFKYVGVSKSLRTESITKSTTINAG